MATSVDVKQLLEAGAHFGHKTSRWHPKMGRYIYGKRGGVHIIDLIQTAEAIQTAMELVESAVSKNRQVLFVGTKRQAQDIVKTAAEKASMPYVTERWFGGILTNSQTVSGRVKHLKENEAKLASGELTNRYNKLEIQRVEEETERLNLLLGGIKDMAGAPGIVFITDVITDHIAVKEAKRLGVPIIAIVDTNASPEHIDCVIPANDDAIGSLQVITDYIVQAVEAGKAKQKEAPKEDANLEKKEK